MYLSLHVRFYFSCVYLTHLPPNYPDCRYSVSSTWASLSHLLPHVYKPCFHFACLCVCLVISLFCCLCLAEGLVIYSRYLGFKCLQCFQFWSATQNIALCVCLLSMQTELYCLCLYIIKSKGHHHSWKPPPLKKNNNHQSESIKARPMQHNILLNWDLKPLKQTLVIAEFIEMYPSGHRQGNKTGNILVRRSLSVPLYQRLLPFLWRGSHISSHTGSVFHCSSFLSRSPPHSTVLETINSVTFHKAVWWGYHLNSFPRPFLFSPTVSLNERLNAERWP